jgi:tRNA-dihydrouridine synthase
MRIGSIVLPNALFVAPMAGVTDRPFRMLCRSLGAGHAVSEMVTSKRELWDSLKTSRRADHRGEPAPIAVQIAGVDPQEMADAARYNIDRGAQIIDINMGCPAKKVCNKWAGSALMRNEPLALRIVEAVVAGLRAAGVPVTLKMRSGWCASERNALQPGARRRGRRRGDGHRARPHARAGLRRPGRIRHRGRRQGRAAVRWWPTATSTARPRRAACCAPRAPTR